MILIVDDNRSNIQALSAVLKMGEYRSIASLNGPMAIEMAKKQSPELILLDINMPGMNGYEVATALKADEETSTIPIIYISALDDLDAKLKAFKTYGVDYITKPFEAAEVLARVSTQLELNRLRKASEKHAEEMEQFAFMAAHDLKAPSNVIESYCNLLLSGKGLLNEKTIAQLKKASQGLRSLVDGLLDLAEASRSRSEFGEIDLVQLVSKVGRKLKLEMEPIELGLVIEGEGKVMGSLSHLDSLVTNLMNNAIKYRRREEGVLVKVTICPQDDGKTKLTFQDDGVGFDSIQAQKLFRPFQRLEGTSNSGHGLGLSICKKVVELHGGQISATGEPGVGATMTMVLQTR